MLLVLALACTSSDDDGPTYTWDTDSGYVDWPDDSGDDGTDADGDGWSVEDGDCDDDDIYVHPGWSETREEGNIEDGKDNDCDGRTDEDFRGIVAVQQSNQYSGAPPYIVGIDGFGEQEWELTISDTALVPYFMTWGVNGGWVVGTLGATDGRDEQVALWEVDETGAVSLLADFSDPEVWPFGLWGITTHPDGYYLATTGDKLLAIEPGTGMVTPVVEFPLDEETGYPIGLYAFDVFVEYATGTIGLFGLYGGFGLVDKDSWEIDLKRELDLENVEYVMWSGSHWDGGGWYAGGSDANGWNVFRFKESDNTWVSKASWDEDWDPRFLTLDAATDRGGYYISSTTGQYPVIWKVGEDGDPPSRWFDSPHSGPYFQQIWDLYTVY